MLFSWIHFPISSVTRKHLGIILDLKSSFGEHLKSVLGKISKTIGFLQKFQGILPSTTLLTICKLFARSHLDYGDIIHDQTRNESFHHSIESIQKNVTIAITDAIRIVSFLESLLRIKFRVAKIRKIWLIKLCLFCKIYTKKSPFCM